MTLSKEITWHQALVTKQERREKLGHHSFVIWFTGLSGSGKSTLANEISRSLFDEGILNYVLDGDNIRHGLNKDLHFSEEDRKENIRRIGETSKLLVDAGVAVITAFISPYEEDRKLVRSLLEMNEFIEVFVDCSLSECENRDPKGLYEKARNGKIKDFTGVDAPYEKPLNPEIKVDTERESINQSVKKILKYLKNKNMI
ncbi:adenylyl-sulfate kinase [Bacillus carboniphilus]|uniref:Adenylyl-sulfate kinase n=1 Tax=Bacillus carboniphilus TaxID=86663 RepID=A0ABY9JYS4_9BACI|nr:adenylyl-sulfate kinase [Bacillus carboniphilus]WLR43590.1 adenylyl-sulfate kinase [Bacillus carboniphilus]